MPDKGDPRGSADLSRITTKKASEPRWMTVLGNWFHQQELKEREAYLAKSTDIFDLERRIRALERQPLY
jgi:hypothetical protein